MEKHHHEQSAATTVLDVDLAPEAVRNAFLRRLLDDLSSGVNESVEDYQGMFPGFEALVGAEYERATAARARSGSGSGDAPLPCAPRLGPGIRVGRYVIDSELAAGGMGVVYLATDETLGRCVVLKTALPQMAGHEDIVRRLRREATLAGRLEHPSLCPVLDVVEGDGCGQLFIVQPFLSGVTLDHILEDSNPLDSFLLAVSECETIPVEDSHLGRDVPSTEAKSSRLLQQYSSRHGDHFLQLMEEIASAIAFAHANRVIHRDLKPSNIMVRPDGRPVILDFGLARDLGVASDTIEGSTLGTPSYMAPEQVRGDVEGMGERTDIYALGVILYKLLTGRSPYRGDNRESLFHAILEGKPKSIRSLVPDVPVDLEAVCLKAMAREPQDRFATAREFAEELARIREGKPTLTHPVGVLTRWGRFMRRHPRQSLAAAAILVIAIGLGFFVGRQVPAGARGATLSSFYVTYESIMEAASAEGRVALTPEEKERLRSLAGEDPAALLLLEDPGDKDAVARLRRAILETQRSKSDMPRVSLEWEPRGAIVDVRPKFVFARPDSFPDGGVVVQLVKGHNGAIVDRWDIPVPSSALSSDSEWVTAFLPDDQLLEPGSYEWQVMAGGNALGPTLTFEVRKPEDMEDLLSAIPPQLSEGLRPVLEASVLYQAGFQQPALQRLNALRASGEKLSPPLRTRAAFLRGAIALALGDRRASRAAFQLARRNDVLMPAHRVGPAGGAKKK